MTKFEFIERLKKESIRPGEYCIVLDKITDAPLVLGCVWESDLWKIYQTKERSGHFIIEEFNDENEALIFFMKQYYSMLKFFEPLKYEPNLVNK